MSGFVNIVSILESKNKLNLSILKKCYTDSDLLKDKIYHAGKELFKDDYIIRNKKILLKPNWVKHDNKDFDEICLRTHDSFVLAVLELVLQKTPLQVVIGDAPIQGAIWDKIVTKQLLGKISQLSQKYNIPVKVVDFRRRVFLTQENKVISDIKPNSDYIIFDLEKNSYLEPISTESSNFRVTNYNPDRLKESHRVGVHKYCITKHVFEADLILSLPKVKTHQKTGITCALKNLVGVNGDKDYLPHHRIGGSSRGGDCYPGNNYIRYFSELLLDIGNRRAGKRDYRIWIKLSSLFWHLSHPKNTDSLAAAWYGNDTCWRMVLDLNIIAQRGNLDGTISNVPQRKIYSLSDGIIGGQGDGPLKPDPLPLNIISFSDNSYLNDIAMVSLMGFDFRKFKLLFNKYFDPLGGEIIYNGEILDVNTLLGISVKTCPPPGWVGYLG